MTSERRIGVPRPPGEPLDDYAAWLQGELDLPGKRTRAERLADGRHRFDYWRPGTLHRVDVDTTGSMATVITRRERARRTLIAFHRMHGYGGGWLYDLWVLLYDLASTALILFAVSGVYLWWRLSKRKLWDVLCLAASWGFAAVVVVWLMYSP